MHVCTWAQSNTPMTLKHATEASLTDSTDPFILVVRPVRLNPNQAEWPALRIKLYSLDRTRSMENTDLPVEMLSALVTEHSGQIFLSRLVCACNSQALNIF